MISLSFFYEFLVKLCFAINDIYFFDFELVLIIYSFFTYIFGLLASYQLNFCLDELEELFSRISEKALNEAIFYNLSLGIFIIGMPLAITFLDFITRENYVFLVLYFDASAHILDSTNNLATHFYPGQEHYCVYETVPLMNAFKYTNQISTSYIELYYLLYESSGDFKTIVYDAGTSINPYNKAFAIPKSMLDTHSGHFIVLVQERYLNDKINPFFCQLIEVKVSAPRYYLLEHLPPFNKNLTLEYKALTPYLNGEKIVPQDIRLTANCLKR